MKVKKRKCKLLLLVALGIFFSMSVSAQNSVSGNVTDAEGEPIIGASVVVKGTGIGTATDIDGNYTINNIATSNATLVFSYMGYKSQEITYSGQGTINVSLAEDAQLLDEIVVIGYGTVRKDDATGSVTAIKADLEGRGLAPNAQDMMVGKIAGVTVTSGGGAPGEGSTIRIRGGSSLSANNEPLIVVDGVPLGKGAAGVGNSLSFINPTDIETFTVLKDASATAIYGSRASNGVIIITTKKGTSGKVKVSYDGSVSVSQNKETIDVMNGDEFRAFVKETFAGATNEAEVLGKLGTANTDWQDEIFRTALNTEHNISLFGSAGDVMPYRVSFGYTGINGVIKNSNMDRYTLSASLSPVLFDDHLAINANAKGMYIKNYFVDANAAIGAALSMDPTQPVYDESSPYGGYWSWRDANGKITDQGTKNPVSYTDRDMVRDKAKSYQFAGNAQFDYKLHFLPELHFNLNLGLDYSKGTGNKYKAANSPQEALSDGYVEEWNEENKNSLLDFYAQYKKDFSFLESTLDVMGGYSWQHFWSGGDGNGDKIAISQPSSWKWEREYYLISYFGRINYNMLNRYMLTFTLRNDQSSRFSKDNRSGIFPSAAFAWRLSEEAFLKNADSLSNLKLRLGWGVTGQQDLGDDYYPYIPSYQDTSNSQGAHYWRDGQWVGLIKPLVYSENLKWEETTTYNVGVDYGFLNNRINGAIDVYYRKTEDMLNSATRNAALVNFGEYNPKNIGDMENKGIEFSINAIPVQTKNLTWDVGFNIAYNENEITSLSEVSDDSVFIPIGSGAIYQGSSNMKAHFVGDPQGMYYVYEQVYDEKGMPIEGLYVDRNNDSTIDEKDLYKFHNATPDVTIGFNTKLIWKSWDFSIAGHGSFGNYNYNGIAISNSSLSSAEVYRNEFLGNRALSALDTNFLKRQALSDYYVQDASFVRIDNITLGWSFNKSRVIPFSGRLYGAVQNPFVFTDYEGLDPEVEGGIDTNIYPRPITYLFGVNINF